jgi:hypothetical protein
MIGSPPEELFWPDKVIIGLKWPLIVRYASTFASAPLSLN